MEYIKIFENWRNSTEYGLGSPNWENIKKLINKEDVLNQIEKEATELRKKANDFQEEMFIANRQYKDKLKEIKDISNKILDNLNFNFSIGQIIKISELKEFRISPIHKGIKSISIPYTINDIFHGWDEKEYGRFMCSDIEVVKKTEKFIWIKYLRCDHSSASKEGVYEFTKRMSMDRFKKFYFNLMTSNEYMQIMTNKVFKNINKS